MRRTGRTPERACRGGPPALRQGPHLLGADPDDRAPWRAWCRGRKCRRCRSSWRCLPQSWFRFAAAAGRQLRPAGAHRHRPGVHHHRPPWNPLASPLRWLAMRRSLRVLRRIQPTSGGFLEATPLTSFVTMGLADRRRRRPGPPGRRGRRVEFLVELGAARRQLADRHEPRDLGDDAVRSTPWPRPATWNRSTRRSRSSRWLLRPAVQGRGTPTPGPTRAAGPGRPARRRARLRRHAGGDPRAVHLTVGGRFGLS